MDKRLIFNVILILLLGIIIGSVLGFGHADLTFGDWLLLWTIIFIFVLLFKFYSFLKPNRLLIKGKYSKAIKYFNKVIDKYDGNKKIENANLYNIALCNNRIGDFNMSRDYLDLLNLKKIDNNIKWGYYFLSATNLILLEKEAKKLQEYLDNANDIYDLPELYPISAYVEAYKNNNDKAFEYINIYLNQTKRKKYFFSYRNSTLITDNFTYDIENNFFIGLTYLKMNDKDLAKNYLEKSSKCKYSNYYSNRAKEILEKLKKDV